MRDPRDHLPDVRDGLTRLQRVILWQLELAQRERGGRNVPTAMLYGRVVEHVDVSVREFQDVLSKLVGAGNPPEPARDHQAGSAQQRKPVE